MYSRGEYYRPEYYRRRGLAAKQRAEQSAHPHLKEAFKDVARHWLALAERVEWLDKHYNDQQADKNQRKNRNTAPKIIDGLQTSANKPPAQSQRKTNGPTWWPGQKPGTY